MGKAIRSALYAAHRARSKAITDRSHLERVGPFGGRHRYCAHSRQFVLLVVVARRRHHWVWTDVADDELAVTKELFKPRMV